MTSRRVTDDHQLVQRRADLTRLVLPRADLHVLLLRHLDVEIVFPIDPGINCGIDTQADVHDDRKGEKVKHNPIPHIAEPTSPSRYSILLGSEGLSREPSIRSEGVAGKPSLRFQSRLARVETP